MPDLSGGQALAQQLKLEGIDTIFGLPGVQLDWAFDALYEERGHIRVIHTRHEQACGYMADGYARATGKIGTLLVVPGPGVLNASAALSTAYACSSPVFCITGNVHLDQLGKERGVLHEVKDQTQMMASVTKWQAMARNPNDVPRLVHEAVRQLTTGRPRPVELEVTPDVLEGRGEVRLLEPSFYEPPAADPDLIDRAAQMLGRAQRPVILSGGGSMAGGAWEELQRLAEALEAPVVMTANGKGALSDRHHLSHYARSMTELAPEADAVLLVGTRLAPGLMQYQAPSWLKPDKTTIRIDIDPGEIARNFQPTLSIVGDAKRALEALAERLGRYNHSRPSRRDELNELKRYLAEDAAKTSPQAEFAMAIRAELPDDGVFVQESTQVGYWSSANFPVYSPRSYLTAGYQGTLGFGFATALGAQAGLPDRKVVSVNGDGGFFYNVQELSTMAQQRIPLTAIVFNDNAYGNVKRSQEQRFGGHVIATDLKNPDMLKLAEAYGVEGRRATTPQELQATLREVFKRNEPVLIEVPVGPMPQARYTPRRQATG
jgi:acetolactate synthase-1/2/3 large subunit